MPHETIVVQVGEWKADIDVMLAPLIHEIWLAGIETFMCCQETEPGMAWVEFDSVQGLVRFLNIVGKYEEGSDTLYNRMSFRQAGTTSAPDWWYSINVWDCAFDDDTGYVGPTDFDVTVGINFPHCDLPVLLKRMKGHNRQQAKRARGVV
jgi:hypothetical protein